MTTKYNLVKETIKSWIVEGKVAPHQKIMSENELVEHFSVSRHTVRQAIGELVNEGWLYREQGRGTFCAYREHLRRKHTDKMIGIVTTYISDYIFPSIIRGAESFLSSKGYSIILASTNNQIEEEKNCLQTLLGKNIDGLIIEPTRSAMYNSNLDYYLQLEANQIPYVMINATYPQLQPPSLTMDDELGGYIATKHLIDSGHKQIVGLFKTDDLQGVNRMKGFVRAHREHQLPITPSTIISFNTEEKEWKPQQELRELLSAKGSRPTGIVCYNDQIAISLLDVTRELKLRVPEDISMVGYDDSLLAEASEVKLTSIKHPQTIMGEEAAKMLLDIIEGKADRQTLPPVVYKPELVIRKSTQRV
ncbi:GntR family transcriptional regulator [Brevibacillus migulae]|uniref:GntR family transcriptional regulator n=1 Tax=Brevibacillus migulae TaxID=1644114 RepID=UPI00106DE88C|nr:GntR family transcriptional regulator [Brevibacillus migulae]